MPWPAACKPASGLDQEGNGGLAGGRGGSGDLMCLGAAGSWGAVGSRSSGGLSDQAAALSNYSARRVRSVLAVPGAGGGCVVRFASGIPMDTRHTLVVGGYVAGSWGAVWGVVG